MKYLHYLIITLLKLLITIEGNPTAEPNATTEIYHETNTANVCSCNNTQNEMDQRGTGLTFKPTHNIVIHGMMCSCHMGPQNILRDDYRFTPGIGTHKLHTRSKNWNEAKRICNDEGGHLAIVNSIAEARVLLDIFDKSLTRIKGATYPEEALIGIHDLYEEGEWYTILGDSLAKTGYNEWSDKWGGQPDNGGGRQNCGALMREGNLDDVACDVAFPFFCEIPTMRYLN